MAQPALIINGRDYTEHVESLTPTGNGLNADGSGRDVQTGLMFRTKITDKLSFEVKMLTLYEEVHQPLAAALKANYYEATILDPDTNLRVTKTFYTDTRPFGAQLYDATVGRTYYEGMTFTMTER